MISYHDALQLIQTIGHPLSSEWITLNKAIGRVVTEQIKSPYPSPAFDQSAMDGFALCADETVGASPDHPLLFTIKEVIAAGQVGTYFGAQTAIKIMTGAPIPQGYTTVLPVEEADFDPPHLQETLRITSPLSTHRHVRFVGEDIQQGDLLLHPGDIITPHEIMVCKTVGLSHIVVSKQPSIALLSTGRELSTQDDLPCALGDIYNSNTPYLQAVLQKDHLEPVLFESLKDDPIRFQTIIRALLQRDSPPTLIISTGAVSKGDFDFIPSALEALGATIHFHGVGIRPGKPILFATLGTTIYMGLPGNPISAAVGYEFFIKPLIQMLQGAPCDSPLQAQLETPFIKKGPFRQFLKARAYVNAEATLCVCLLNGQESAKVNPLLKMNAWVILDENTKDISKGQFVPLIMVGALQHD